VASDAAGDRVICLCHPAQAGGRLTRQPRVAAGIRRRRPGSPPGTRSSAARRSRWPGAGLSSRHPVCGP